MAATLWRHAVLALAVVVLNFALPRVLPGDPLEGGGGEGMTQAVSPLTAQARAQLLRYYRLDRPLPEQFAAYLADLAQGDLGSSISRPGPVVEQIALRLPWTLGLLAFSLLIATVLGIGLGLVAGWRGGRLDAAITGASAALAALPEFLVALGLLATLAVGLRLFPLQGGRTTFAAPPSDALGLVRAAADVAWHLALPAATLVLAGTSAFVLLTRDAVRAVASAPYLNTARAKGLSDWRVAIRHALPNALGPVLTLFGLRVGQLLGGAIVVERVFAVPGLGLLAFEAIGARDYPVLQAIFLLASLGVLAANLAVELAYRWVVVPGGR